MINQLKRIKEIIRKKKDIGKYYYKNLKDIPNIYIQKPHLKKYIENIYWVVGLLIKNKKISAEKFRIELKKYGIETRAFFWPMHRQTALKKIKIKFKGSFKNSDYYNYYTCYNY